MVKPNLLHLFENTAGGLVSYAIMFTLNFGNDCGVFAFLCQ